MQNFAENEKNKVKLELILSFTPDTVSPVTAYPKSKKIERILTTDPEMDVVRRIDAGYEETIEFAERINVKIPMKK